jgi:hypothetical protein
MDRDHRHHRAHAPAPIVVFVPFESGSPAWLDRNRPGEYPQQRREPWRPQRSIPVKQRKAQRIVEIMRELAEREAEARRMLQPNAALLKQWLAKAA